jgi:hypothetical protein
VCEVWEFLSVKCLWSWSVGNVCCVAGLTDSSILKEGSAFKTWNLSTPLQSVIFQKTEPRSKVTLSQQI